MDAEITPPPGEDDRRAILAALDEAEQVPYAYTSAWRAAALDELGDDALAQERWSDPGIVEP